MKTISKIYTGIIFLFLYAPIVIMIIFSFNDSKSRSVWHGFTTKWYAELFHDDMIIGALRNTLLVSALAAVVSTLIGTMAAVGIYSMKKRWRTSLLTVNNIPIINPEIVTGVSLMLMFVAVFGLIGKFTDSTPEMGFTTLIIAHITFNIPYVLLSVMPKLRQMNKHTYEAALDLGCTPMQGFFKAVLPEIMPGVITGMIMAFTLSIDDFVISYFTSGPTSQTLSVVIYGMTRKRISPKVNALSAIMFAAVLVLLLIINLRQAKDAKKAGGRA